MKLVKNNNNTPSILMSMGTRPEVIKMAPVYHELCKSGIRPTVLHTGQHNGMATALYKLFGMTVDYNIDLGRQSVYPKDSMAAVKSNDMAELTAALIQKVTPVIAEVSPCAVLVHGDTTSAVMAALAAFYLQIPVAHVEAGLRSFKADPFPEEKNREMIARLAHWHFAPTNRAAHNLEREGIHASRIFVTGNTIVDATHMGSSLIDRLMKESPQFLPKELHALEPITDKRVLLVTAHRRENQAITLQSLTAAIRELLEQSPDLHVVWPVHPNPHVSFTVRSALSQLPESMASRLFLTDPLSYPVLLWVLKHAWAVLTDSGGIQEEATALNVPVLIARDVTERPEVVESGAGLLVGTQQNAIISAVQKLRANIAGYNAMRTARNPFGDGTAAYAIVRKLLEELEIATPESRNRFYG